MSESHRSEFIELRKWLKERKFEDTRLVPASFPGTGRGLMSTASLQKLEGQVIISLPESCLLTTDTVIRSSVGPYIKKWKPPLSPLLALCTFLLSERHAGSQSLWKSYLDVLPTSYTCPVCLEPEVVDLLPGPLKAKADEQRARVQALFAASGGFFSTLQPLFAESVDSVFSYQAFLWAWCTVNTRAVYLSSRRQACLSAEPDTCALAPFLDLLNHSPHVQVKAAFNEETRCYEIRTASRCRKHQEVFICYGPHDNQRLLLEYEMLVRHLPTADKQVHRKISILKDHGFTGTTGHLLRDGSAHMGWPSLTKRMLCCWVLGAISSKFDVWMGRAVLEATHGSQALVSGNRALVSDMKEGKVSLMSQLSLVEALRMEELRILQASAEILSSSLAPFS
ncbi:SET domain-containing protein 4 [Apodemus speciosus]|uniref:SET domain-containing protein 4 n=1 Tax=Apodemus speciosus TaxID=105296 RepID=A0ABQ0FMG5_APOSI